MTSVRSAAVTVAQPRPAARTPAVTGWFWAVVVSVSALGEALADGLGRRYGPAIAVPFSAGLLAAALVAQLGVRRYVAGLYWTTLALVGVTVTLAADVVRTSAGTGDAAMAAGFAAVLAAVVAVGYPSPRLPAVRGVPGRRREVLHWTTVVASVGLGSTLGDWATAALDLGLLVSAVLSALVVAAPALARLCGLDPAAAFWSAMVATRPLGASIADWVAVPTDHGGLGWGATRVATVTGALSLALVTALRLTRADVDPE